MKEPDSKVTIFIPLNQPDANGDVFSHDCKFTWPDGVSELHRDGNGVTIIKSCRLDEISLLPDGTYGVGLSNVKFEDGKWKYTCRLGSIDTGI